MKQYLKQKLAWPRGGIRAAAGNKKELKSVILRGLVAFGFLGFFSINAIKNKNNLKNVQDYTIGKAIKSYKGIKMPIPAIDYVYTLNGVKFKGTHGYDPKKYKVEIDKNYLVIYSPDNPANSRMLLNAILPDSAIAPSEGWRNAPFGVTDTLDKEW